mmetsp:Transcript_108629/g.187919  ORF Transcript_108629/g.187919 Transcript_108629/m.187919 type:complete len:252 (-) Transcript_108629:688-1443(-)
MTLGPNGLGGIGDHALQAAPYPVHLVNNIGILILAVDLVDLCEGLFIQGNVDDAEALIELLHGVGADDEGLVEEQLIGPCQGKHCWGDPLRLGQIGVLRAGSQHPVTAVPSLEVRLPSVPPILRLGAIEVLATQSTPGQQPIRATADIMVPRSTGLRQFVLEPPVNEGEIVLDAHRFGHPQPFADLDDGAHAKAGFVADGPMVDLALRDELLHGLDGLLQGHSGVGRIPEPGVRFLHRGFVDSIPKEGCGA